MQNKSLRSSLEEGSVTVEAALVLTVLVAVLMVFVGVVGLGKEQAQLCRVAGDHARNVIVSGVQASPNTSVSVQYRQEGDWVHVVATRPAVRIHNLNLGNLSCEVDTLVQPSAPAT